MEYSFHIYNQFATDGLCMAIDKLLKTDLSEKLTPKKYAENKQGRTTANFRRHFNGDFNAPPVVVCIGSDLAVGDSLGPIVGSMLKHATQGLPAFIYGTLASPITAKEIPYLRAFLRETHPSSQIIAVDAAVGAEGDIGLIKLNHAPLFPGAGANKRLGAVGDISILGVVAEKSVAYYGLLNTTRLNLVYTMSRIICDALSSLLWERGRKNAEKPLDKAENGVV